MRMTLVEIMECCRCTTNNIKVDDHFFINCHDSKILWSNFARVVGIQGPFIYIRHIMDKY